MCKQSGRPIPWFYYFMMFYCQSLYYMPYHSAESEHLSCFILFSACLVCYLWNALFHFPCTVRSEFVNISKVNLRSYTYWRGGCINNKSLLYSRHCWTEQMHFAVSLFICKMAYSPLPRHKRIIQKENDKNIY